MTTSAFNAKDFMKAEFRPRTGEILLPALKGFFTNGAQPLFKLRGLNAVEIANTNEAAITNQRKDNAIQAITDRQEEIEIMREALGISVDIPYEIAKRIEQLIIASIEPKLERRVVLKLQEVYPIEFYQLTNEIIRLTGLGMDLKKPEPSGTEQISDQH